MSEEATSPHCSSLIAHCSSGRQAVEVAGEEAGQADVGQAEQLDDEALQADGEATVRRHAVAEGLEVLGERFRRHAATIERGQVVVVAVESLPAGDDLKAAEDQ